MSEFGKLKREVFTKDYFVERVKDLPCSLPDRMSHTITSMMTEIMTLLVSCEADGMPPDIAIDVLKNVLANVVLNTVKKISLEKNVRESLMDFVQETINTLAELEKEAGW